MFDRSVQFPQRYQLQKVAGTDDIYDIIPAPGEIQNEGTLINKSTLLKDATAALFGLGEDAVPDEVLVKAFDLISKNTDLANTKSIIETGTYIGTGTVGQYSAHNKITFSNGFPKMCLIFGYETSSGNYNYMNNMVILDCIFAKEYAGKKEYTVHRTPVSAVDYYSQPTPWWFFKNSNPSTLEWAANTTDAYKQMNVSGRTYRYYALY